MTSLEEEVEKLQTELNERKENFAALEKSVEHLKTKNNVSTGFKLYKLLTKSCHTSWHVEAGRLEICIQTSLRPV